MKKILSIALSQVGIKEVPGDQDNPEIIKYFDALGFEKENFHDETAWCSAAMNYICKMAGKPYTGKLNARSWLDVGIPVASPQVGDIVIFWRESKDSWKGHVGIFINSDEKNIYCLGGNQGNQYGISPYLKSRVLGFRRV